MFNAGERVQSTHTCVSRSVVTQPNSREIVRHMCDHRSLRECDTKWDKPLSLCDECIHRVNQVHGENKGEAYHWWRNIYNRGSHIIRQSTMHLPFRRGRKTCIFDFFFNLPVKIRVSKFQSHFPLKASSSLKRKESPVLSPTHSHIIFFFHTTSK